MIAITHAFSFRHFWHTHMKNWKEKKNQKQIYAINQRLAPGKWPVNKQYNMLQVCLFVQKTNKCGENGCHVISPLSAPCGFQCCCFVWISCHVLFLSCICSHCLTVLTCFPIACDSFMYLIPDVSISWCIFLSLSSVFLFLFPWDQVMFYSPDELCPVQEGLVLNEVLAKFPDRKSIIMC